MTTSFDSGIENFCRNMNVHATFTVKHANTIVATSVLNYCNIRTSDIFKNEYYRCI